MITAKELEQCWRIYQANRDENSKETLIRAYLHLVKRVVGRIKPLLPPSVEEGDLISYGLIGLIEAIDRFDPNKGVPFETFAIKRIRGAVIDGLRQMGWIPRSAYQRAKQLQETIETLEQRLGHSPSEEELADELGMTGEEYLAFVMEAAPVTILPLEELLPLAERVNEQDVLQKHHRRELSEILAHAIEQLPERERLVIALYFYEQLTLKEIAKVMKLTEGRVCQLKTQALMRLRAALKRAGW